MAVFPSVPRIHFDFGVIGALGEELKELGIERPLIITDQGLISCGLFDRVKAALPSEDNVALFDDIPENPTVEGVERALERLREEACDGVVAVGGGSVIDSSKAVALRAGHPGPLSRYDQHPEMVTKTTAPIIAVPTTAGTGSEVSRGAGIHPDASSASMVIGGTYTQPRVAICDPELTLTLPPSLTAATGMDALGHCVEGFLASPVNPPVDAVALDGIRRVRNHLEGAVADGSDREARWHMLMAALEGGMSIGKGLGPAHAIGNTLGDRGFHHGTLVTVVLPSVLRFMENHAVDKMQALADAFELERGQDVPAAVEALNRRLGLPVTLKEMNYPLDDIGRLAKICEDSYFHRASPRIPNYDEYKMIITDALG